MNRAGAAFLSVLLLLTAVRSDATASTALDAMKLAAEGERAVQAADLETSIAKLKAAVDLRPDFVHLLETLAKAQTAAGRPAEANATLDRLARTGLYLPAERAEEFTALRASPEFKAVVKKFAANLHPQGKGEVAFSLREVRGLIEGISWRAKTGEFYFGDANARCIWVRNNKDGSLRRLTAPAEELWGVFGIAIDEASGTVWAATSAVPAMLGFTAELQGMAALAEIDLESGAVRQTIPVPRRPGTTTEHTLKDVAVTADGAVFLTDSAAPVLWRLAPGGSDLAPWVESDEFFSLEGLAVTAGGVVLLADRANGLLRIDPADRTVRRLELPPDVTLLDVEGLVVSPPNRLFALQSGLRPTRVLRIDLNPEADSIQAVQTVESGHMAMAAPSRGCLGPGGDLFYIGFAGRARFEAGDAATAKPRSVPIFTTKLPVGEK